MLVAADSICGDTAMPAVNATTEVKASSVRALIQTRRRSLSVHQKSIKIESITDKDVAQPMEKRPPSRKRPPGRIAHFRSLLRNDISTTTKFEDLGHFTLSLRTISYQSSLTRGRRRVQNERKLSGNPEK
ncbi:hypothetical protein LOD99_6765 [Oopsacas minuta]|uniref:Uncharacterized protein n=1 Tax=Oopsacas minuta TaxID=111878 RepID=A0AAV7JME7_9METZ|nr:hypothetical protein LOD99_6765 [Oopsacas minuta]